MKFKLVEDYTDEEIHIVVNKIRQLTNGVKKFTPLGEIRSKIGQDPKAALIFNKLHDRDIVTILKENAKDKKIKITSKEISVK